MIVTKTFNYIKSYIYTINDQILMKRFLLLLFVFLSYQISNAQYTEIINSKRPGFAESPYSVGTDVYQLEGGLYYINNYRYNSFAQSNAFGGELFFRFSKFIEKLEVNVNVAFQNDKIDVPIDFGEDYSTGGVRGLTIGAKYMIFQKEYTDQSKEIRSWKARTSFDKKRLIPSIGAYVGVNTNFLSEAYKAEGISFKGAVLLQNDFTDRLVLITNLIVDDIGLTNMIYAYIVSVTYTLTPSWSVFLENVGKYQTLYSPEYQLGAGTAYLLSKDLQVDASIRTNIFDDYSYVYASAGLAWRLDLHKDSFVDSGVPKTKKKKGFFSKIFGKKK